MNAFDRNLGYIDEYGELNGLGSKIKKGLKKVDKAAKKVRQKTLPKKVNKVVSKAAKNPVVRTVAAVALTTFGIPAIAAVMGGGSVGAAVSATAAKTLSAKGIGTIVAKEAGKKLATKAVSKVIEKKLVSDAKKEVAKLSAKPVPGASAVSIKMSPPVQPVAIAANMDAVKSATAAVNQQFNELINDKEFITTVKTMQAQGKSLQEINDEWQKSKAYKAIAGNAAATVTAPIVYEQAVKDGLPQDEANAVAEVAAQELGRGEAGSMGGNLGKFALIAVPLAMAFLG